MSDQPTTRTTRRCVFGRVGDPESPTSSTTPPPVTAAAGGRVHAPEIGSSLRMGRRALLLLHAPHVHPVSAAFVLLIRNIPVPHSPPPPQPARASDFRDRSREHCVPMGAETPSSGPRFH